MPSPWAGPSDARLDAAALLRSLGHAIVTHEVGDEHFAEMSAWLRAALARVEEAPARTRPSLEMKRDVFAAAPPDGGARSHFPDCIVTGLANPMGMAAQARRDGDDGVVCTTLGAAFEGAPGRAHGGAVAALFDEVMGFVLSIHATPAYTGRLSVTYRAPTPLGEELEFRARLRSRHGRKLTMEAEARHAGSVIAEAEGIFVAVDPERFAHG
ncbi:MAG TPA: PaaI family thioesterase [Acidimicrobiales bacterium]|nr:PaaI family thioesterase [Acidimicrobiales bacterium]